MSVSLVPVFGIGRDGKGGKDGIVDVGGGSRCHEGAGNCRYGSGRGDTYAFWPLRWQAGMLGRCGLGEVAFRDGSSMEKIWVSQVLVTARL